MSRELPYVLITGFSHSGTSLVCNLVHKLGFSPGSQKNMKGYDPKKRPWGYWEHWPLRVETHTFVAGRPHRAPDGKCTPGFLPPSVLRKNVSVKKHIFKIATGDNVEVYKDLYLPLLWCLFPTNSKYIVIERDRNVLWQHWNFLKTREQFDVCWRNYRSLAVQMAEHRPTLFIKYEDFATDLRGLVSRVAEHVGADTDGLDWDQLLKIYVADKKVIDV
jgi:hypothetical protein